MMMPSDKSVSNTGAYKNAGADSNSENGNKSSNAEPHEGRPKRNISKPNYLKDYDT